MTNITKIVISSEKNANKTKKSKKKKFKKLIEGINVYYIENLVNLKSFFVYRSSILLLPTPLFPGCIKIIFLPNKINFKIISS